MAEELEPIGESVPQGMGIQLLEQGVPGDMFTCEVQVYRVRDTENPANDRVRVTLDGDSFTLTCTLENALIISQKITDAATDEEPLP